MWKISVAALGAAILVVSPVSAQDNGYSRETLNQMRQQLAQARSLLEQAQRDYAQSGGPISAIEPAFQALHQAEQNVRDYEKAMNAKAIHNMPESHSHALPPGPRVERADEPVHHRVMEVVKGKIREHVVSKDRKPQSKWCTSGNPTPKMPKCRSTLSATGVRG